MNLSPMIKRPTAVLPLAMSLAALATVAIHVALFGAAREPDEGTAAHLWQLLMALQLPIVVYFAITYPLSLVTSALERRYRVT